MCGRGNLRIKPTAGTALLWYNHLSDGRGKERGLELSKFVWTLQLWEVIFFIALTCVQSHKPLGLKHGTTKHASV